MIKRKDMKKKMKKKTAIITASVLCAGLLIGCGKTAASEPETISEAPETVNEVVNEIINEENESLLTDEVQETASEKPDAASLINNMYGAESLDSISEAITAKWVELVRPERIECLRAADFEEDERIILEKRLEIELGFDRSGSWNFSEDAYRDFGIGEDETSHSKFRMDCNDEQKPQLYYYDYKANDWKQTTKKAPPFSEEQFKTLLNMLRAEDFSDLQLAEETENGYVITGTISPDVLENKNEILAEYLKQMAPVPDELTKRTPLDVLKATIILGSEGSVQSMALEHNYSDYEYASITINYQEMK